MENIIKKGDSITFKEESLSYEVKAKSVRFAICVRKFDEKEDVELIDHEIITGAYLSKKEALKDLKDKVIYTIVDFKKQIRGSNNYIFNVYDYSKQEDIDKCLDDLKSGECEISRRNQIPLTHFSVDRRINNNPEFVRINF